jgi:hydrogenase maturation protease
MAERVAVIGLGNPLMGDDGIGVHLVEMLREDIEKTGWAPPDGAAVELVDAGADPLLAGAWIAECPRALLIDAAEIGAEPGDHRVFSPAAVRRAGEGGSPHAMPFSRVLELLEASGAPVRFRVMGIQAGGMAAGAGLSPAVQARVPEMLRRIKQEVSLLP